MNGYVEVFNIAHEPFMGWAWLVVPFTLFSIAVILARTGETAYNRAFGAVFATFTGAMAVLMLVSSWIEYASLRDALAHGRVLVAEGRVENFHPDSPNGKAPETFSVSGVHFEIRPTYVTAAFHNTTYHGGDDLRAYCARILYVDDQGENKIVWLGTKLRPCNPPTP